MHIDSHFSCFSYQTPHCHQVFSVNLEQGSRYCQPISIRWAKNWHATVYFSESLSLYEIDTNFIKFNMLHLKFFYYAFTPHATQYTLHIIYLFSSDHYLFFLPFNFDINFPLLVICGSFVQHWIFRSS